MKSYYSARRLDPLRKTDEPVRVVFEDHEILIEYIAREYRESMDPSTIAYGHNTSGGWSLLWSEYPFQELRFDSHPSREDFLRRYPHSPVVPKIKKGKNPLKRWLLIFLLLFLAFLFWLVFVFPSWFASTLVDYIPMEREREIGRMLTASYLASDPMLKPESAALDSFFRQLSFPASDSVKLFVTASEEINAFAIPGGFIFVPKGMLNHLSHPDELAALLAHEYSHVELRHSMRSFLSSSASWMVLSTIFGDISGWVIGLDEVNSFKSLAYSRSLEEEADLNGLKLLRNSRLNQKGMTGLMHKLQAVSAGAEPPAFLSSHPQTKDRINLVNKDIEAHPSIGKERQLKGYGLLKAF